MHLISLILNIRKYTNFLANVSLMDDMKNTLSSLVTEGMARVQDEVATQVGVEVRAEMARQTDELMSDLGVLRGVKSTVEICLEKLNSNSKYLGEKVQAIDFSTTELATKIDGIEVKLAARIDGIADQLATAKSNQESISHSSSKLSAVSALLSENLKVTTLNFCPF